MKFPKDFLWGAATSAYQVEGGIRNNWTPFFDAGIAADHYHRFREDFDLARSLGHNAHRFSIEWSRIEPQEGEWDMREIEHYRDVIRALRERNLEPFVTLWHWTIPIWLEEKGGWLNPVTIKYFEKFCEKIVGEFRNDVCFWITLNEPMVYASHAYWRGDWPSLRASTSIFGYLRAIQHLARAHCAAHRVIKRIRSTAQIGIAKHAIYFEGRGFNAFLRMAADWWWNDRFINLIKDAQDFIGINYYFHNRIQNFKFNQNENKEVSDMGWEIYPEGIYHILKNFAKYKKPLFILENGIADALDIKRGKFIQEHLQWAEKAISEGNLEVCGYFYWSLIDNFEWDKDFEPRFGLIEVDYTTMERKIRPSAKIYRQIILGN